MLQTILLVVHVLVALALIAIILLQQGARCHCRRCFWQWRVGHGIRGTGFRDVPVPGDLGARDSLFRKLPVTGLARERAECTPQPRG